MSGYADYYGGRRQRSRIRPKHGRTAESDTMVTVIAIQIIACVILILTFAIYKNIDKAGFEVFKEEYASLVRDNSRNGELMEMFSDVTSNFSEAVNSFETYLSRLLDGFGRGETPGLASSQESSIVEDKAHESLENPADTQTSTQVNTPDFNYLSAGSNTHGAGGWFPVENAGTDEAREAPAGSVLSPVILSAKMSPPVTGIITSGFGYRYHPVTGDEDFHTGMDIASNEDTPILAALPGEVIEIGESDIYGKYIKIRHSEDLITFYAHCSEILAEIDTVVRQGERIARVGHTGVTTGPHLHFSVITESLNTDPYWVLSDNIKILDE